MHNNAIIRIVYGFKLTIWFLSSRVIKIAQGPQWLQIQSRHTHFVSTGNSTIYKRDFQQIRNRILKTNHNGIITRYKGE